MQFKQLVVEDTTYDLRTIQYTYDALSRLTEANYNNGAEILTYGFDVAGNMTNNNGASRTYNAANQLVNDGTNTLTYDDNGNMTSDGTNSYVWDRANRLLSMGGISYAYNGDGNRIQQDALNYILDLQPGLAKVIGDSDGNRYVHSPRGIHAVNDGAAWTYPVTDALGSVRGYVGANNAVLSNVNYTPIGVPDTNIIGPAFTGEWRTGGTGIQYHRARYYNPNIGIFPSLDPFEGVVGRPMSLNGYSWVEGNLPNATDASGLQTVDWDWALNNPPSFLNAAFDFPNFTWYVADLFHNAGYITRNTENPSDFALAILINQLNRYRCQLQQNSQEARYINWEIWLRLFANGVDISQRRYDYDPIGYVQRYAAQNEHCQTALGGGFCIDPTVESSPDFQNSIARTFLRQCLPLRTRNSQIAVPQGSGTLEGLLYAPCFVPQNHTFPIADNGFPSFLLLGGRFDASANVLGAGWDVNLEIQFVPHHLLDPQYWFRKPAFGFVINTGPEISTGSAGINVGVIAGLTRSESFGENTLSSWTVGGTAALWAGPTVEVDASIAEDGSSIIVFVGGGAGVGPPTVYAGTSSSFFVDPGKSIRDIANDLLEILMTK